MRDYRLSPLPGNDGRWYLRMEAPNGQINMGAQQGYSTLSNARRAGRRLLAVFASGRVKFINDPWQRFKRAGKARRKRKARKA